MDIQVNEVVACYMIMLVRVIKYFSEVRGTTGEENFGGRRSTLEELYDLCKLLIKNHFMFFYGVRKGWNPPKFFGSTKGAKEKSDFAV